MFDLKQELAESYGLVKGASIHGNVLVIESVNQELEHRRDLLRDDSEQVLLQSYLWCFEAFRAHTLIRAERYAAAIDTVRKLLRQRDELVRRELIDCELHRLNVQAEYHALYLLGLVKWLSPAEYRNEIYTPEQMLELWLLNLERIQRLGVRRDEYADIQMRLCGQTVLQSALRFCPELAAPVMLSFNLRFDTCLNTQERHYRWSPFVPQDCYLYWSMELAKAMYSRDLCIEELKFLQFRERRALYNRNDELIDRAYGDASYNSFSEIIARRFCKDYAGYFSLNLPSLN